MRISQSRTACGPLPIGTNETGNQIWAGSGHEHWNWIISQENALREPISDAELKYIWPAGTAHVSNFTFCQAKRKMIDNFSFFPRFISLKKVLNKSSTFGPISSENRKCFVSFFRRQPAALQSVWASEKLSCSYSYSIFFKEIFYHFFRPKEVDSLAMAWSIGQIEGHCCRSVPILL
jgi:hypothetical protein